MRLIFAVIAALAIVPSAGAMAAALQDPQPSPQQQQPQQRPQAQPQPQGKPQQGAGLTEQERQAAKPSEPITVTGCVREGEPPQAGDQPQNFVLVTFEEEGTRPAEGGQARPTEPDKPRTQGTTGQAGRAAATPPTTVTYDLIGAPVVDLRPYVGKRVEIKGLVDPPAAKVTARSGTGKVRAPTEGQATGTAGKPTVETRTEAKIEVRRLRVSEVKEVPGGCPAEVKTPGKR